MLCWKTGFHAGATDLIDRQANPAACNKLVGWTQHTADRTTSIMENPTKHLQTEFSTSGRRHGFGDAKEIQNFIFFVTKALNTRLLLAGKHKDAGHQLRLSECLLCNVL